MNAVTASPTIREPADAIVAAEPRVRARCTEQDAVNRLSFSAIAARLRAAGWSPRVDHGEAVRRLLGRLPGFVVPTGRSGPDSPRASVDVDPS